MKNKYILSSLFLAFSLSSCDQDQLLNTVPPTQLSSADVFGTPERILGLVNGVYKELKSSSLYGGRYLLYLDVRGEDFINITGNTFTGYESWNNSYSPGSNDIINLWSAGYTTINRANVLIDGLQKNQGVVSSTLETQYIAEAKFLRALAYYSLITVYARPYNENNGASPGLPLRLIAETTPANNDLARSSVADVYRQILKDLDEAEAGLPQNHATALLNTTRAHKNTAIALKTRVYLNQNNWDKVIEEAKKIAPQTAAPFSATSGVNHQLQNVVQIFASSFTTNESVFSIPFTSLDNYGGQSSVAYIYNTNSEYYLNPAAVYGDPQWGAADLRREWLRVTGGRAFLAKYGAVAPFLNYIHVIRYSEVLLNYAEALARKGETQLPLAILKAVHGRSDASFVFPEASVSTSSALVNTILKERRIELLGEGFRSNDLLRNLQPIPAKGSASLSAGQVNPQDENYIFPIANTEIATNKLL
jgi:hypothetical protein